MKKFLDLINLSKLFGTKIPVWDGNANNLPKEGQRFLYNDQEYVWEACKCGNPNCGRPKASINGKYDFAMTIRLRGTNQGNCQASVLCKLGKTEELIQTDGKGKAVARLLDTTLGELRKEYKNDKAMFAFFATKDISEEEMLIALTETLGMPPEFALLMAALS